MLKITSLSIGFDMFSFSHDGWGKRFLGAVRNMRPGRSHRPSAGSLNEAPGNSYVGNWGRSATAQGGLREAGAPEGSDTKGSSIKKEERGGEGERRSVKMGTQRSEWRGGEWLCLGGFFSSFAFCFLAHTGCIRRNSMRSVHEDTAPALQNKSEGRKRMNGLVATQMPTKNVPAAYKCSKMNNIVSELGCLLCPPGIRYARGIKTVH